jgi:excisionase family DNA binding protein
MRTELQSVLSAVLEMRPEQLPELLGELEVVRSTAMMKLTAPISAQPHDELLSIEQASERLGMSTDYLYRHSKTLPFTRRMGRKLLFSSLGIEQFINRGRR